ncbi:unnamed protein product [Orchesella dallaii]|uniref:Odorant receptor n=1 Tax=Orchesella dallaii TaxID=48710 RepID=A0ABP1RJJ0_9HEXA
MEPMRDPHFMLNDHLLLLTKYTVKVTSTIGFTPMYIDTVRGKATVNNWSWARAIHFWSWIFAYAAIVLPTHTIEVWLSSKDVRSLRSNKTVIYLFITNLFSWFFTLFLGLATLKPLVVCQLFNSLYKYIETFPAKYIATRNLKQERIKTIQMEFLFAATTFVMVFVTTLFVLYIFLHPNATPFPAYRVPIRLLSLPIYLVACSWPGMFAYNFCAIFNVLVCNIIFYFFSVSPIIRDELRLGRSEYKTTNKLREPYHLVMNYRAIQILVKTFNLELGMFFVPGQMLLTQIILVCNVSLLFQWDLFELNTKAFLALLSVTPLFGYAIFLWMAGLQYQGTVKTVNSWKLSHWNRRQDRMYMERVKKTCFPISFGDGKRYIINPKKVLQFINSVSRNTFRAIAMYGKVFGY